MDERRLRWAVTNSRVHRRGAQPAAIGPLVGALLSERRFRVPAWRRRLVGLLEACGGDELFHLAEPRSLRGGVLTMEVAEPTLCYDLRVRWERRLLRLLQEELPEAGIHAVRFCVGSGDGGETVEPARRRPPRRRRS